MNQIINFKNLHLLILIDNFLQENIFNFALVMDINILL